MEITLHRAAALPAATLAAVHGLLIDGGEVDAAGLEKRLATVAVLALLRDGEAVLGVAALKRRRRRYAAKLAAASGFRDLGDRRRELGYVYVVPALRGKGWGRRLIAAALGHAGGEPLYATTRTDNPAIAHILERFGFRPAGRPWRSQRGRGTLMLWVTADWRARPAKSRWAAIGRRLVKRTPERPSVLLVSLGGEDWTAIRLAGAMRRAGFDVAVAAPMRSLAIEIRNADRLAPFGMPDGTAWRLRLRLRRITAAVDPAVVVPVNHRAAAFVHHLATTMGRRPEAAAGTLGRSLGDLATIPDRLLKHRTLAVARSIGVRVPAGGTVATAEEAAGLAGRLGFPVVLKAAFGAGGHGVVVCRSAAEIEAAFPRLIAGAPTERARLGRPPPAWLPSSSPIDVQAFVDGVPAMSCAVAKGGEVLAVLAAVAVETADANGPASVVRLVRHPEIEAMTAAMVAAFGASGFVSFDFLIDRRTGEAYLVECNPRPIGIAPLGHLVGCDLVAAFRGFVDGATPPPLPAVARSEATVALFPRALVRDPPSAYLGTCLHDVPTDEPAALARFLEKRGLSLDPAPAMLEAAE